MAVLTVWRYSLLKQSYNADIFSWFLKGPIVYGDMTADRSRPTEKGLIKLAWISFWSLPIVITRDVDSLGEETVYVVAGFTKQRKNGTSLNSWRCVGSTEISVVCFLTIDLKKSWMEGRSVLMILCADVIVHCSLDQTCCIVEPTRDGKTQTWKKMTSSSCEKLSIFSME